MVGENKHQNIKIRKKFKKRCFYRCCNAREGNQNKISRGFCCTYPQNYKRRDATYINKRICRNMETDIVVK